MGYLHCGARSKIFALHSSSCQTRNSTWGGTIHLQSFLKTSSIFSSGSAELNTKKKIKRLNQVIIGSKAYIFTKIRWLLPILPRCRMKTINHGIGFTMNLQHNLRSSATSWAFRRSGCCIVVGSRDSRPRLAHFRLRTMKAQ
jgi:hypothetical protein